MQSRAHRRRARAQQRFDQRGAARVRLSNNVGAAVQGGVDIALGKSG